MAICVPQREFHPCQNGLPMQSNAVCVQEEDMFVLEVDRRVAALIQRLQKAENVEGSRDIELINDLRGQLGFAERQSNKLHSNIIELNKALAESKELIDAHRQTIKNSGIGFGAGAAISAFFSFSTELTILALAAGIISGMCATEISKKNQSKTA